MKKSLLIYGAGGLGREVLSMVRSLEEYEPSGFIDDQIAAGTLVNALKVLGGLDVLNKMPGPVNVVLAFGDPARKAAIVKKITHPDIVYPVIIHPSAIIQDRSSVLIGNGSIITAGCILTTNIRLGDHVLININATLGHDVTIGNCSSVMPGVNIAGEVTIGESVLVGSGANIMNRITLADSCRVGMGAVVLRDVPRGQTVAGVPAKPIRS